MRKITKQRRYHRTCRYTEKQYRVRRRPLAEVCIVQLHNIKRILCLYNRLPEDKTSYFKHVEDIVN